VVGGVVSALTWVAVESEHELGPRSALGGLRGLRPTSRSGRGPLRIAGRSPPRDGSRPDVARSGLGSLAVVAGRPTTGTDVDLPVRSRPTDASEGPPFCTRFGDRWPPILGRGLGSCPWSGANAARLTWCRCPHAAASCLVQELDAEGVRARCRACRRPLRGAPPAVLVPSAVDGDAGRAEDGKGRNRREDRWSRSCEPNHGAPYVHDRNRRIARSGACRRRVGCPLQRCCTRDRGRSTDRLLVPACWRQSSLNTSCLSCC
jgi:hypothetical protein